MTGRDEDSTMILTIGYTGLRWGEAIGLEHGYLHPGEIHVEWQLRELGSRFHRLRPRTTPTAARPGSRVSLSTCRLS